MKARCSSDDLKRAVASAAGAVGHRSAIEVLKCIHLKAENETLSLTGTDLSTEVKSSIKCVVETDGVACVAAKTLDGLMGAIAKKPILLEREKDRLTITVDEGDERTSQYGLECIYDDFPNSIAVTSEPTATTTVGHISDAMKRVGSIVNPNAAVNAAVRGIEFIISGNGFTVSATDLHQLSICRYPCKTYEDQRFIMHGDSIPKLLSVPGEPGDAMTIRASQNTVSFEVENYVLTATTIDASFPVVNQFLNMAHTTSVAMDTESLSSAVRRCLTVTEKTSASGVHQIRMAVNDEVVLESSSRTAGHGIENVAGQIDAPPITITLNGKQLLGALRHFTGKTVELRLSKSNKPAQLFDPSAPDWVYITMPIAQ